jgi:hypothetical protein
MIPFRRIICFSTGEYEGRFLSTIFKELLSKSGAGLPSVAICRIQADSLTFSFTSSGSVSRAVRVIENDPQR